MSRSDQTFPLPGPAMIIKGTEISAQAASLCSSFNFCKYSWYLSTTKPQRFSGFCSFAADFCSHIASISWRKESSSSSSRALGGSGWSLIGSSEVWISESGTRIALLHLKPLKSRSRRRENEKGLKWERSKENERWPQEGDRREGFERALASRNMGLDGGEAGGDSWISGDEVFFVHGGGF